MWCQKDTLAYQLSRPGTTMMDISAIPLPVIFGRVDHFMNTMAKPKEAKPESEALWFYLQNHAVALVRMKVGMDDPLGSYLPIVEDYQNRLSLSAARMFSYLLLICTRESRHKHSGPYDKKFEKKYGEWSLEFYKTIKDGENCLKYALQHAPNIPVGVYTEFLVDQFFHSGWSPGYGGEKWAKIAEVLDKFVHGVFSAEMMVDTGFTLAHNGGPIFNKGMLYTGYSRSALLKILDTQAMGGIPWYVRLQSSCVYPKMCAWQKEAQSIIGSEFGEAPKEFETPYTNPGNKKGLKYKVTQAHAINKKPVASTSAGSDMIAFTPFVQVKKLKRAEVANVI